MADVDMTDAPGTTVAKKATDGETKVADGKKRFEVKKVGTLTVAYFPQAHRCLVERRCPLGVGYCR